MFVFLPTKAVPGAFKRVYRLLNVIRIEKLRIVIIGNGVRRLRVYRAQWWQWRKWWWLHGFALAQNRVYEASKGIS
jgi:hypothetical protein